MKNKAKLKSEKQKKSLSNLKKAKIKQKKVIYSVTNKIENSLPAQRDNENIVPSDSPQLSTNSSVIDGVSGETVWTIRKGCLVAGEVEKTDTNALLIRTTKGLASAHITDVFDEYIDCPLRSFKPGQLVKCYVLECPTLSLMKVSLKPSHTSVSKSRETTCININSIRKGDLIQGYIKCANEHGVFISLSRTLDARAGLRSIPSEILGIEEIQKVLYPGRLVTCYVAYVGEGKVNVSLLRKHTGVTINRKTKWSENPIPELLKSAKKVQYRSRAALIEEIQRAIMTSKIEVRLVSSPSDDGIIDPGWSDEDDDPTVGKSWAPAGSHASDDEEKIKPKQLSKKERLELAEAEESVLRQREIELMDDTKAPQTSAEWERLMTSEPDNSLLWIRYMAFHIHATEIDEAREVAAKALRAINFRKENEKLNVWVSLLNLENMYGTDVTMEETLRRAMQENDQRKVLKHLVNIYTQAGKLDKAKETHESAIKKFRGDKDSWLAYIRHLMVDHKQDNVQAVLERCLKSVERRHHMEVISKVAQMEFKHGDVERGRTIFENLITSFPKRTDVWSIYLDMLVQLERYDEARQIFNRVTSSNLSSKKISSFFKRYVEFEVNHGNESTINDAKTKALSYLNDSAK